MYSQEVAKIIEVPYILNPVVTSYTTSCQDQEIYTGTMPRPYSDITGFTGSHVCVCVCLCTHVTHFITCIDSYI